MSYMSDYKAFSASERAKDPQWMWIAGRETVGELEMFYNQFWKDHENAK